MPPLPPLLLLLALVAAVSADGMVAVDSRGDLAVTPLAGGTVFMLGVNVPDTLVDVDKRLRALEAPMQLNAGPAPAPPSGPATGSVEPRIGQDLQGNLWLIPSPNRTVVLAGMRVLELLAHADQRLAALETLAFGPRAAPNVTSLPRFAPLMRPGTVGQDAGGNIRIEPMAGKAVLAAGRDVVLELHRITARLNQTEAAMLACPCLAPPATCHPCGAGGCVEPPRCNCTAGWQGPDCRGDQDECELGTHNCHAGASCSDTRGSFSCACNSGRTGNGLACADVNECTGGTHNCHSSAVCNNTLGSFLCACRAGFAGNGTAACANVDECTLGAHNCPANSTCIDTPGSFTCPCHGGFFGADCKLTRATMTWARQKGTILSDAEGRVAVDDVGRVFMAGQVGASLDGLEFVDGSSDMYLVAYNASTGAQLWSQILGSPASDMCGGIAADGAGNVFVTGLTGATFGDGQLNMNRGDMFLARFGGNGTRIWTRLFGTTEDEMGRSVAVNRSSDTGSAADAVFVCGYTSGPGLPGSASGSRGGTDAFAVRYGVDGTRSWVLQFGSAGHDECYGVAVYQSAIYATGSTSGLMAGAASAGLDDIFVARITAQGTVAWIAQLGSGLTDGGRGIAVDRSGVYVTGYAQGSLGGQPFSGANDGFVARYSHETGVLQWVRMLGTSANDFTSSITLDRSSIVLVTGWTGGALGGQARTGVSDVFVASFSSNGVPRWTQLFGGTAGATAFARSITVDGSGSTVYVAGEILGSIGGQNFLGGEDLFTLKLRIGCAAGLTGDGAVCSNVDECASQTHTCNASSATCADTSGSFTCACNAGFIGNGVTCVAVQLVVSWARQTGSTFNDFGGQVAVDDEGRVFLVGRVNGAVDGLPFAGGISDVLVTAFQAANGSRLWSQTLGSTSGEQSSDAATDGLGNLYVTGSTSSSALDGQTSAGSDDVFLVSYDGRNGTRLWTRLLGSAGSDNGHSVAVDRTSNAAIYIGGYTLGILPTSGGASGMDSEAFVAQYTRNGTRAWVRQFGSSRFDQCFGISVFQSEVYATGLTYGVMAGVVAGVTNAGNDDVFVAKLTAQGQLAWVTQLGTSGRDQGLGIAVDSSGVYVVGDTFGPLSGVPNSGSFDAFVARYTLAGNWSWTRLVGSSSENRGISVKLDRRNTSSSSSNSSSKVLVGGHTSGSMLNGQPVAGNLDVFVASFSAGGELLWTRVYGTAATDFCASMAVDDSTVFLAGNTGDSIGGQPRIGNSDLFVLALREERGKP